MDSDDIFNVDILDVDSSSRLADNLSKGDSKINELRLKLFSGIYENLLNTIKNSNKYLKKKSCIYSIPSTFNGVVVYRELKRCFMKHILIRLNRENFKINLIDKETILISW